MFRSQSAGLFKLLFELFLVIVLIHGSAPYRYDEEAAKISKRQTCFLLAAVSRTAELTL
jgi:hypothetical protein